MVRDPSLTLCYTAQCRIQLHVFKISHTSGKKNMESIFFLDASMSNAFLSFCTKTEIGFHTGDCCSPSKAKWESSEII